MTKNERVFIRKFDTYCTLVAHCEIENLGQGDYFSVTGELYDSRVRREKGLISCGMLHDDIARIFPELVPFLKWHLTSFKTGPMHYIENARYWAGFTGKYNGLSNPKHQEYLESTIVYGALQSDSLIDLHSLNEDQLVNWLKERFQALMDKFYDDMAVLYGLEDGSIKPLEI